MTANRTLTIKNDPARALFHRAAALVLGSVMLVATGCAPGPQTNIVNNGKFAMEYDPTIKGPTLSIEEELKNEQQDSEDKKAYRLSDEENAVLKSDCDRCAYPRTLRNKDGSLYLENGVSYQAGIYLPKDKHGRVYVVFFEWPLPEPVKRGDDLNYRQPVTLENAHIVNDKILGEMAAIKKHITETKSKVVTEKIYQQSGKRAVEQVKHIQKGENILRSMGIDVNSRVLTP